MFRRHFAARVVLCVFRGFVVILAFVSVGPSLAEDNKPGVPRITAIAPIEVVPGTTTTLRIRGVALNGAAEIRFPGAPLSIRGEIITKKNAELPNGLEAKDVGDTMVEAKVAVPADLPSGALAVSVVTSDGTTPAREVRVVAASQIVDEKEPNGGFREAQSIEIGMTIRALIKEDKDVDVFTFEGVAGQKISAEVIAVRCASLLDSVLTLYDAAGHLLATSDDAATRDAQLALELPVNGKYYVSVQDAQDRGGGWHAYELIVRQMP
jgi:hypothetical protein